MSHAEVSQIESAACPRCYALDWAWTAGLPRVLICGACLWFATKLEILEGKTAKVLLDAEPKRVYSHANSRKCLVCEGKVHPVRALCDLCEQKLDAFQTAMMTTQAKAEEVSAWPREKFVAAVRETEVT